MAGTAPRGFVWVLIEYRGGWPINGFDGLDLDPETKARVFSAAQAQRARILLVRRPGRRTAGGSGRWAVLRFGSAGGYRQQWGTWNRDEDLAAIATALDSPGELGHPPVILVCTHGQHDVCCAVRGRPVGRALGERWPELVWECAHVGGDRFAANVVVAPDGVYYGNLDEESAVRVIEDHLADRINVDHLRGYTDLFSPHQAAIVGALKHFGPAGRNDYVVAGTTRDGDTWRIRLTGRPSHLANVEVEVHARRTPPHQLTCRGRQMSSAIDYELVSVREL
ncbi:sucrase ferredoxin [Arthrobacter echini]|uniref:Sucrase ferredoxin n=1 Tax=Arthrobacter echini TaxID=1529066 RepID=A0A4S5E014_9MICC|nr:sucrase ferredoxin [Arthrobacter echini]THJ64635.1 sucrase ferredoxin [Arthrobacter echini]